MSNLVSDRVTGAQKKLLILSSLGGVIEFYDFIIYIFLAPIIEKVFFSSGSTYIATLKTLAIFSIGYLLRPLGGIIFSHFGDRYGRKVVFLMTVIFMALPSLLIGMLPVTGSIAAFSPIFLLLLRMMQGLALGGEIPAAITFVAEHVSENKRSLALSVLFFGINFGLLAGSFITATLTTFFNEDQMVAFGWRIPFLIGGLFGLLSLYLRRHLYETSAFTHLRKEDVHRIPWLTLMKYSYRQVFQGMSFVLIGSVTVFLYLYWPQYLHQYMNYDFSQLMRINTVATLFLNFTIILGGLLADRYGYRTVYMVSTALLAILSYPLFALFQISLHWVVFSYAVFSLLFGFIPGSYSSMLYDLFPTSVRYSGIAMSYNLAYAIFGGLSPLVCTVAIHHFNSIMAPAFYVMVMAVISFMMCFLADKRIVKTEMLYTS